MVGQGEPSSRMRWTISVGREWMVAMRSEEEGAEEDDGGGALHGGQLATGAATNGAGTHKTGLAARTEQGGS